MAAHRLDIVARILDVLINAYLIIILLRVFSSWGFLPPGSPIQRWLYRLTEPVLRPFRRLFRSASLRWRIDWSPVAVILILEIMRRFVWSLFG